MLQQAVAGTLAVNGTTTINGGVLNVSSNSGAGTATFTGAVTVNGGQLNLANGTTIAGTAAATASAINVLGGLFVVSNSGAAGTLTQSGVLTINGGTYRMTTTTGAATVNLNSNLTQTSGSFVRLRFRCSFFYYWWWNNSNKKLDTRGNLHYVWFNHLYHVGNAHNFALDERC
jgi:hypothetical protein